MFLDISKKQSKKLTPTQAVAHLTKVNELLEFYLGSREDSKSKEILRTNRMVQKLIIELEEEKYSGRKAFKNKFWRIFGKQKEILQKENKELKIELKQEQDKHDD